MLMTKKILIVLLGFFVIVANAQTSLLDSTPADLGSNSNGVKKKIPFAERKAKMVEHAQKQLNCIQAAQNEPQLKSCRPKNQGHFIK